jgi:imidazolonepropionase-like amidohydrolase
MTRRIGLALLLLGVPALAAAAPPVLFENVRIFDGVDPVLSEGHVLVEDGRISRISAVPIDPPRMTRRIDGRGRILTPGLIDLHAHLALQMPKDRLWVHPTVSGALAAAAAALSLEHGFTTVRDAGGTHPDVARAIEAGLLLQ